MNKRPQLSGHPLPAIFDPESLSSISPPDFESDGKVRSRYVTIDTIDSTLQNVKDSKDFEARKSDPLYLVSYLLERPTPEWRPRVKRD